MGRSTAPALSTWRQPTQATVQDPQTRLYDPNVWPGMADSLLPDSSGEIRSEWGYYGPGST
jgi:hypothetical protein